MKNDSVKKYMGLTVLGLVLLAVGLGLIKWQGDAEGMLRTLPYICVGVGAGVFGSNLGTAIKLRQFKKHPETARQVEIEEKDERNIAISNQAKAKAYDLMLVLYSALLLGFALMQVALQVILALVGAYLLVVFTMVYYLAKYQEEM